MTLDASFGEIPAFLRRQPKAGANIIAAPETHARIAPEKTSAPAATPVKPPRTPLSDKSLAGALENYRFALESAPRNKKFAAALKDIRAGLIKENSIQEKITPAAFAMWENIVAGGFALLAGLAEKDLSAFETYFRVERQLKPAAQEALRKALADWGVEFPPGAAGEDPDSTPAHTPIDEALEARKLAAGILAFGHKVPLKGNISDLEIRMELKKNIAAWRDGTAPPDHLRDFNIPYMLRDGNSLEELAQTLENFLAAKSVPESLIRKAEKNLLWPRDRNRLGRIVGAINGTGPRRKAVLQIPDMQPSSEEDKAIQAGWSEAVQAEKIVRLTRKLPLGEIVEELRGKQSYALTPLEKQPVAAGIDFRAALEKRAARLSKNARECVDLFNAYVAEREIPAGIAEKIRERMPASLYARLDEMFEALNIKVVGGEPVPADLKSWMPEALARGYSEQNFPTIYGKTLRDVVDGWQRPLELEAPDYSKAAPVIVPHDGQSHHVSIRPPAKPDNSFWTKARRAIAGMFKAAASLSLKPPAPLTEVAREQYKKASAAPSPADIQASYHDKKLATQAWASGTACAAVIALFASVACTVAFRSEAPAAAPKDNAPTGAIAAAVPTPAAQPRQPAASTIIAQIVRPLNASTGEYVIDPGKMINVRLAPNAHAGLFETLEGGDHVKVIGPIYGHWMRVPGRGFINVNRLRRLARLEVK